jgi:hypothetical protein
MADLKDDEHYSNPNLNPDEDYNEKDIEHVLRQGDFSNWEEALLWLRDYGADDIDLGPSKVKYMIDDFEMARDKEEEFTNDPDEICSVARKHRS